MTNRRLYVFVALFVIFGSIGFHYCQSDVSLVTSAVCEGGSAYLQCNTDGQKRSISIKNAFFGRRSSSTMNEACPSEVDECPGSESALTNLRELCEGREGCYAPAYFYTLGEHSDCSGVYKYLEVEYTCRDCYNTHGEDEICQEYVSSNYHISGHVDWMHENCFKASTNCHVGECGTSFSSVALCDFWTALNECTLNNLWMPEYCKTSCRACEDDGSQTGDDVTKPNTDLDECRDVHPVEDCEKGKQQGKCSSLPKWMNKYCAKTCTSCLDAKSVVACEEDPVSIDCGQGNVISIQSALWGRGSDSICVHPVAMVNHSCQADVKVSDKLAKECEDLRRCEFRASRSEFGDPCPGSYKYLELEYICEVDTEPCTGSCIHGTCNSDDVCVCEIGWSGENCFECAQGYSGETCQADIGPDDIQTTEIVCEGYWNLAGLTQCPVGTYIAIEEVFFGRENATVCTGGNVNTTDCPTTSSALALARDHCEGRPRCYLPSTYLLGDNCPGTSKYLYATYKCRDCTNKFHDDAICNELANRGECRQNRQEWMFDNCYKSCSKCLVPDCGSSYPDEEACNNWAFRGECKINQGWMESRCTGDCRACENKSQPSVPDEITDDCVDVHETTECEKMKKQGDCQYLDLWMNKYCKHTCGHCEETKHRLACEGTDSIVKLACEDNKVIKMQTALWGRGDDETCTHPLMSNTSCQSDTVLTTIRSRCEHLNVCEFSASVNALGFLDPCPGTYKYLEMTYTCENKTCPHQCVRGYCNGDTNVCTCDPGWAGDNCEKCADGYFGRDCTGREERSARVGFSFGENYTDVIANDAEKQTFVQGLAGTLAAALDVTPARIDSLDVYPGSIMVEFVVLPGSADETSVVDAVNTLKTAIDSNQLKTMVDETTEIVASADSFTVLFDPEYLLYSHSCEESRATVSCEENAVLHITNVFFARRNRVICSHDTIAESTCASASGVIDKVRTVCEGRQHCSVPATTKAFGDSCEGTYKHLEVEYQCKECKNLYDADTICAEYYEDGLCESSLSGWMQSQCFKACSQCHNAECGTLHSDVAWCDDWAFTGECEANPNWMLYKCATSCGNCNITDDGEDGSSEDDEEGECVDIHPTEECEAGRLEGKCNYLSSWMKKYCAKSCKFCTDPKSVLACEGSDQDVALECPDNHVIQIQSALFGRGSDTICVHETAMKNSSCQSDDVFIVLQERCDGKKSCTFEPTLYNLSIPDPCPGTYKYLEMDYVCIDDSTYCSQHCASGICDVNGECVCDEGWNGEWCSYETDAEKARVVFMFPNDKADIVGDDEQQFEATIHAAVAVTSDVAEDRIQRLTTISGSTRVTFEVMPGSTDETFVEDAVNNMRTAVEGGTFTVTLPGDTVITALSSASLVVEYDPVNKHMDLVCEASDAELRCSDGKGIYVETVFWGRQSESICPHSTGNKTDCETSRESLNKVLSLCEGRQSCDVYAYNYILGETCYGTSKYLEVVYTCKECENTYDADNICAQLVSVGHCSSGQFDFMGKHCYKACSGCSYKDCGNNQTDTSLCDYWAGKGECELNQSFMLEKCAESCGNCDKPDDTSGGEDSTESDGECEDIHSTEECLKWFKEGRGTYLAPWMNKYCAKTTGFCTGTKKVLACEGEASKLNLECEDGELINVTSALFGRGDATICVHSTAMLNNSCQSDDVLAVLDARCSYRDSCNVTATVAALGVEDPCVGSYKYLEMEYKCLDASTVSCVDRCKTGTCTGEVCGLCEEGWAGVWCHECADGWTGPDCDVSDTTK